jgi:hypothetical protein
MTKAFVLGNGKSLQETPLHLLEGEETYAVNRVHMIYEFTDWRPKNLVWMDYVAYSDEDFEHTLADQAEEVERCYYRFDYALNVEPNRTAAWPQNIVYLKTCYEHTAVDIADPERRPEAWHFPEICRYGGSVQSALQIAVLEEFNPIILLGCDLGIEAPIKGQPNQSHLHPDYPLHSDFPWENRNPTLVHAHEIAKRYTDAHGIQVYNATLGGELEVYPRISLEEALCL